MDKVDFAAKVLYTIYVIKKGTVRMFLLDTLNSYIEEGKKKGLDVITPEIKYEADGDLFYITKTKEVYIFGDEESADALIDEARQNPGFAGCDKKFKAGKINKQGETVKPDSWIVTVKFNK